MHAWKVGDEAWGRYYDAATDNYVARLYGHVTGVGPKGFTVRLSRPLPRGLPIAHHPHDASFWATKAAADEYIAAHPFNAGRARA